MRIKNSLNRRGQITIFVILAIAIVLIIGIFIYLRNQKDPSIEISPDKNPEFSIHNCISSELRELIREISKNGGYFEPELVREFNEENYTYLCYNENYYSKCINQEPMLIQHLKKEIKDNIFEELESCFQELKIGLEKQGYSVEMSAMDFNVVLMPSKVLLEIDRDVDIVKTGESRKFEEFDISASSKIYDLVVVSQEIISQEAEFCNFDSVGYMLSYPKYEIEKKKLGDGDLIYYVRDKKTKEEFRFAIKTCIMPGGL